MTASKVGPTEATTATPVRAIRGVRLLEVDPELGNRLADDEMTQARRDAILATIALTPGRWEPGRLRGDDAVNGEVHGFLMLSGVLLTELLLAGHAGVRLVMPGETVLFDEPPTTSPPASWGMVVLADAQLAVFDDRLLAIARHWPALLSAILKRAGQQSQYGLLQQAISQLPRIEDRLLALLWSLADRHGIVRPDGVWVPMPVTHHTLAQLVGARRPTVSLGLRSLTEQGVLRAEQDGWLIAHDSPQLLSSSSPASTGGGM